MFFPPASDRFSTSSALYQLNYGVLCDLMVFNPSFSKGALDSKDGPSFEGDIKYYYELPTEWAMNENQFKSQEHMWVLILKDNRAR